jgi:anti-sigma factor RsiW
MSCPEDRMSAWIDGELADHDARVVEDHVAGCARCTELAARLRSTSRSLSQHFSSAVSADPGFLVRFRERRDRVSVAPWWTWRQLALRVVPLAAAVLLAAIATLLLSSAPDGSLQEVERDALGAPVVFDGGPEAVLSIALEPFPEDID